MGANLRAPKRRAPIRWPERQAGQPRAAKGDFRGLPAGRAEQPADSILAAACLEIPSKLPLLPASQTIQDELALKGARGRQRCCCCQNVGWSEWTSSFCIRILPKRRAGAGGDSQGQGRGR